MPRTLIFDINGIPQELRSEIVFNNGSNTLNWINLRAGDDIRNVLPEIVDRSSSFTEDLLEEQRPRIQTYQTLEDNDDTYTVIVLAFPTPEIFKNDEFVLQISFLILDNTIYSAASSETNIIPEIMATIVAKKNQHSLTSIFRFIVSELLEYAIQTIDQVEDFLDNSERRMLEGGLKKGWLASLLSVKGRLFDTSKIVKADIEHIRELKLGIVPEIDTDQIVGHLEDRSLFLLDFVDAQREDLTNLINLHLAIASNMMNRQFYWLAVIGSILVIPTIVSSIWGMNLDDIPDVGFWEMVFLMGILTVFASFIIKLILPKPYIS